MMTSYASREQRPRPDTITAARPTNAFGTGPAQRKLDESLNKSPRVQVQLRLRRELNRSPRLAMQAKLASKLNARTIVSAASGLVAQRLILGANGDIDTHDTSEEGIDRVVAELQTLDYDSLLFIRRMLDPEDERDRGYIKLINYELAKADSLSGIEQSIRRFGGNFSSAAVLVDGQLVEQTDPVQHPDEGQQYYRYLLDEQQATGHELDEEHNSRVDAEVGTLEEAYEILGRLAGQFTAATQIRIVLTGSRGPCDGCKVRVEEFQRNVLDLLPDGAFLSIDSAYFNSTSVRSRNDVDTRYGYEAQAPKTSALGSHYYNYRFPNRVKGQG